MNELKTIRTTAEVIRSRKTDKLFADIEKRGEIASLWTDTHRGILKEILDTAGHAPFHKKMNQEYHAESALNSAAPWRFYVLEGDTINQLIQFLSSQAVQHPDSEWTRGWNSKIKNMLAACGALVQVTWLPEPENDLSLQNIEHIAAASAATQNMLLAAEAQDWISYWSSGGILRSEELFTHLKIPTHERLLGSVFLTPKEMVSGPTIPGKMRDQRGQSSSWSTWLELNPKPYNETL